MRIKNPVDGSIGETTEEAFEAAWQPRGWTAVSDDTPTTANEAPPVGSFDAMSKADLVSLAQVNGVDDTGTKAELIERLRAAGMEG
jgi:hypothetical protein